MYGSRNGTSTQICAEDSSAIFVHHVIRSRVIKS